MKTEERKYNKVIAAGHVCLDITPVFKEGTHTGDLSEILIPGKLIEMDAANIHTGGSVANTGLALKLLGNDVILLGKVGEDELGTLTDNIFAGYGAGGLIHDPESTTSYSVVLAMPGIDRIFLHSPGANNTFCTKDIPDRVLDDAAFFHFGYPPLMKRMYENGGAELVGMYKKIREYDIATGLDLAAPDPRNDSGRQDWKGILEKTLPYVDFFYPSFEELCFMLDRERYDELIRQGGDMTSKMDICSDAGKLADICLKMGCGSVLIKCGTAGMYYKTGSRSRISQTGRRIGLDVDDWTDRKGIQPIIKADRVLSATGAGDVSIAAFITAVLNGEKPDRCVYLAACEGAASVSSYDALGGIRPLSDF